MEHKILNSQRFDSIIGSLQYIELYVNNLEKKIEELENKLNIESFKRKYSNFTYYFQEIEKYNQNLTQNISILILTEMYANNVEICDIQKKYADYLPF